MTSHAEEAPARMLEIEAPAQDYPQEDVRPEWYRTGRTGFEGPTETVPGIAGVVLAIRPARWLQAPGPEDAAPLTQCSLDRPGVGRWILRPGDPDSPVEERACATCPMNAWGSAGGGRRGKACREKRLLLVLRDGEAYPLVVVAPPSSLVAVARWVTSLARRGLHPAQVRVRLAVTPQKSGQQEWGVLRIEEQEGLLDDAALEALARRLAEGPAGAVAREWRSLPALRDDRI